MKISNPGIGGSNIYLLCMKQRSYDRRMWRKVRPELWKERTEYEAKNRICNRK